MHKGRLKLRGRWTGQGLLAFISRYALDNPWSMRLPVFAYGLPVLLFLQTRIDKHVFLHVPGAAATTDLNASMLLMHCCLQARTILSCLADNLAIGQMQVTEGAEELAQLVVQVASGLLETYDMRLQVVFLFSSEWRIKCVVAEQQFEMHMCYNVCSTCFALC